MIITHAHFREFRYCNKGGRVFFERHKLDWSDFVKNGIDAQKLIATGDHMAIKLVEFAKSRTQEKVNE